MGLGDPLQDEPGRRHIAARDQRIRPLHQGGELCGVVAARPPPAQLCFSACQPQAPLGFFGAFAADALAATGSIFAVLTPGGTGLAAVAVLSPAKAPRPWRGGVVSPGLRRPARRTRKPASVRGQDRLLPFGQAHRRDHEQDGGDAGGGNGKSGDGENEASARDPAHFGDQLKFFSGSNRRRTPFGRRSSKGGDLWRGSCSMGSSSGVSWNSGSSSAFVCLVAVDRSSPSAARNRGGFLDQGSPDLSYS